MVCTLCALPAVADSQVRIVRLSDVQGSVQIDKNTGLGFENAFLNLPITQGTQLRTGEKGRAEIEFEDGSALRLTPRTTVEFGTLGLTDAGKRISAVTLVEGRAYVNWLGKSADEFTLNFSRDKITITQPAHFRVAASSNEAEVASFKNEIEVVSPSGTVKVDKKKMVIFGADDKDQSTVAKNLKEDLYDDWDKQSVDYHDQYAKNNSTPYGYGSSDLSYYGGYTNFPGLRNAVAAVLHGSWLESLYGRRMVLVSGHGIYVGFGVPLGMDALLLRKLGVCAGNGMGMATGRI